MKNQWTLTQEELTFSASFFQAEQIPGIRLTEVISEPDQLMRKLREKKLLQHARGGYRLDSGFELALLTMLDPSAYLCLQTPKSDADQCNVYLRGSSIILLSVQQARQQYHICWLPYIPLAIGGVYDFFCNALTHADADSVCLRWEQSEAGRSAQQFTLASCGEDYLLSCEGQAPESLPQAQYVFTRIQRFLAYAHSGCLKGGVA